MEITATTAQTVQSNQNVLFTDTVFKGNYNIIHRNGSGLVTLRGLSPRPNTCFNISFGGNIALPSGAAVAPISLAIAIDGEPVSSATMIVTPTATTAYSNVSSEIEVAIPKGCCSKISVQNVTASQSILVQNANLIVEEI